MARSRTAAVVVSFIAISFASATARAANFGCNASAALPALIRGEGSTELVGDLVLTCTGGTRTPAGQNIPQVSLTVTLNASITSRMMTSSASEALLLVDEPGSAGNPTQLACGSVSGCTMTGTAGAEPYNGASGRPNIFRGSLLAANTLTFLGVPLDPAGDGTRVLRITNLRANASEMGASTTSVPNSIVAFAGINGGGIVVSNPQQTVAFIQTGLIFSVRDGADAGPLNSAGFTIQQASGLGPSPAPSAFVRFREGFVSAFSPRTVAPFGGNDVSPAPASQMTPGLIYNSESGFTLGVNGGTAGLADYGTRLKAFFNGVPAGVNVWVGVINNGPATQRARLVGNEINAFSPAAATDSVNFGSFSVAQIPIVNGAGTAVWEVLSDDPLALENFDMPVWFTASAPTAGTGVVSGSLAPNPAQGAFNAANGGKAQGSSYPIPRFVDTSSPVNVVQVTPGVALSANPASLAFTYQVGTPLVTAVQPVTLSVSGASSPLTFVATASTNGGGNWLGVSWVSNVLPGILSVFANPGGLAVGTYTGSLTVSVSGANLNPLVIPVSFTVSTTPPGTTSNPTISHIADGAGWRTTIILLNTGATPASFTIRFWDESGNPMRLPLGHDGITSQLSDTIPVTGSRTIQTDGVSNALAVGWAEILSSGSIGGTAIFGAQVPGQADSEAAVPITSTAGRRFLLPFDNSPGAATGVAVANPSVFQNALVSVVFRDQSGQQTGTAGPYNVPAHGHISFVLPASAGVRGVAEFTSPQVDVVGLGIRGHGRTFTSVESQMAVPAGDKTISHLADGGGWKTTIILVNTDAQPAPFTIRFRGDGGTALRLSLGADGRVTTLSGTIAPGGSRTIQTDGTAGTLATGWAELSTSFAIGGTAIFGAQVAGQPDSEAAVPIIADMGRRLLVPFDGTAGFGTGLAFANPSTTQTANVLVVFRNVFGQQIGSAVTYRAPANGHASVVLPVNVRGVAELSSPDTPISALGIRSHNGAFTSVRTLVVAQ